MFQPYDAVLFEHKNKIKKGWISEISLPTKDGGDVYYLVGYHTWFDFVRHVWLNEYYVKGKF